jgi:hypothetical protein
LLKYKKHYPNINLINIMPSEKPKNQKPVVGLENIKSAINPEMPTPDKLEQEKNIPGEIEKNITEVIDETQKVLENAEVDERSKVEKVEINESVTGFNKIRAIFRELIKNGQKASKEEIAKYKDEAGKNKENLAVVYRLMDEAGKNKDEKKYLELENKKKTLEADLEKAKSQSFEKDTDSIDKDFEDNNAKELDIAISEKNSEKPGSDQKYRSQEIFNKRIAGHKKQLEQLMLVKNPSQELIDAIVIKKEAITILEKRVSKNKGAIFDLENKNTEFLEKTGKLTVHTWEKFKTWYTKPENKKELHKRILVSGVVAAGISVGIATGAFAAVGLAGLGAKSIGAVWGMKAARFAGSYGGGEILRNMYTGTKEDYRQRMADFRLENGMEGQSEKDYSKGLDAIKNSNKSSAKYITNKNKWAKIWDRVGRVTGGLSVTGVEAVFSGDVIDKVPEINQGETPPTEGSPNEVFPPTEGSPNEVFPPTEGSPNEVFPPNEVIETPTESPEIPDIAHVKSGDGITQILKRQLDLSPDLAKQFGIIKGTPAEYAKLAEKFGVMDDSQEVRLILDPESAYVPTLDGDGKTIVQQFKGGELVETYQVGDTFEASDIEETEYLEKRGVGYREELEVSSLESTEDVPLVESLEEVKSDFDSTDSSNIDSIGTLPVLDKIMDINQGDMKSLTSETFEKVNRINYSKEAISKLDFSADLVELRNGAFFLRISNIAGDNATAGGNAKNIMSTMLKTEFGTQVEPNSDLLYTRFGTGTEMKSSTFVKLSLDQATHFTNNYK